VSIEKHIDKMISEAVARGEFKNLKGEGKPLDLDAYFATPEDVRLGYSVLKSNEFVPEEVDRLKEIGVLRDKIAACGDDAERTRMKKLLSERELALSLIVERNRRRRK
jgi:hypothetical protein